ncbi:uncharacterized protein EHS24_005966 [Apiotrichum porosum]|uniref:Uncharacterized protein n=1 Tax=Apiotrichum porosum TaxID=105984 RepID=A0A427Y0C3_9TREE|nr:uncharacterized protein EHS24_005966 [Apiotrichum porosum]RSH84445.1 hypothetical protein EHS24_005966 [Apiotrichum porosum]
MYKSRLHFIEVLANSLSRPTSDFYMLSNSELLALGREHSHHFGEAGELPDNCYTGLARRVLKVLQHFN